MQGTLQIHFSCEHIQDWRAPKAPFSRKGAPLAPKVGHCPADPLPMPLILFYICVCPQLTWDVKQAGIGVGHLLSTSGALGQMPGLPCE